MPEQSNADQEDQRRRKHFDERSDFWFDLYFDANSYAGYTHQKQHHAVLSILETLPDGAAILDVGCGAGVTVLQLAEMGYRASGLDNAPQMITRAAHEARNRGLSCDFNVSAAEMLPYRDNQFDAVFGLGLLGNIRDHAPVLNEMRRVLKPGGMLLVTVPNILALDLMISLPRSLPIYFLGTRFRSSFRMGGNFLRALQKQPKKDASSLTYGHLLSPRNFKRRLRDHGFVDSRNFALTFGPMLPFGLRWGDDKALIQVSEAWAANDMPFKWGGTSMLYTAKRPLV